VNFGAEDGKIYNLLVDENLMLNARYAWVCNYDRSIDITAVGVRLGDHTVSFNQSNIVLFDGNFMREELSWMIRTGEVEISKADHSFKIQTPDYTVHFGLVNSNGCAKKRIDLAAEVNPHAFPNSHGILGLALRNLDIEGSISEYEVNSLFADNLKLSLLL